MLIDKFSKILDKDIREKYKIHGDAVAKALSSDIRAYNRSIKGPKNRISSRNMMHIDGMIKSILSYLTSYYCAPAVDDYYKLTEMHKTKEAEIMSKLHDDTVDKRVVVMNYLLFVMMSGCINDSRKIYSYNTFKDENWIPTEEMTRMVIENVGYTTFIKEMYIQLYIMSIFRSVLFINHYNSNPAVRFKRDYDGIVSFIKDALTRSCGDYQGLSIERCSTYRSMKAVGFMKFSKDFDSKTFINVVPEIVNKENTVYECFDVLHYFLLTCLTLRKDNKLVDIDEIRAIGRY